MRVSCLPTPIVPRKFGSLARPAPRGAAVMAVCLVLGACGDGSDQDLPSATQLRATCASIVGKQLGAVTVSAAKRYEADSARGTPGFCQVQATQPPYLDFEVVLPDNWSGRLWQQGGGGFDGFIDSAVVLDDAGKVQALSRAVGQQAAVYATSNGGNRQSVAAEAGPMVWFDGTPAGAQSLQDYDYASVGKTVHFAKALTAEFYGRKPSKTYFSGCSNGGRNAYAAIQRWPEEYDGVVSGCMGMDLAGQTAMWMNIAKVEGTPAMPTATQWNRLYQAAVAACDAKDGLTDGIIANYAGCDFDVGTQACGQAGASSDPSICLSAAQVATAKTLVSSLTSSAGSVVYSKYPWADWSTSFYGVLGGAYMAIATSDVSWITSPARQATFDLGQHLGPLTIGLQQMGADNDKRAVADFIAVGKKVIHWHDGADELVSLEDHQRNIALVHEMAKAKGLAEPAQASRFFIVPGTNHSGGQALTAVDWSKAIVDWVEAGIAPSQLTYTASTAAQGVRTLPVCPYPQYPRYVSGDTSLSTSYTCTAP